MMNAKYQQPVIARENVGKMHEKCLRYVFVKTYLTKNLL